MKKFHIVASLLVLLTLLLAACSSAGEENIEGTPGANLGTPEEATEVLPGTGATTVATNPVATLPPATEAGPTAAVATPAVGVTSTVTTTTGTEAKNSPALASYWFGRNIENSNGDTLGEIKGLVVDQTGGRIQYAILGAGGFLGIGEKLILVPFSAFKIDLQAQDDQQMVTLNLDQNALTGAPNYDQLPDMTAPDWDKDIRAYWADKVQSVPATGPVANAHSLQLNSLDSIHLLSVTCNNLGHVKDLILATTTGQITYVLAEVDWDAVRGAASGSQVSPAATPAATPATMPPASSSASGQMNQPDGNLVLIPWNAFVGNNQVGQMGSGQGQSGGGQIQPSACQAAPDQLYLIFDTSKVDLTKAPVLKSIDELPDVTQPDWDKDIHNFWDNIHS